MEPSKPNSLNVRSNLPPFNSKLVFEEQRNATGIKKLRTDVTSSQPVVNMNTVHNTSQIESSNTSKDYVTKENLKDAINEHLIPLENRIIATLTTLITNSHSATQGANASGEHTTPGTSQRDITGTDINVSKTTGQQNSRKRVRSPSPEPSDKSDEDNHDNDDRISIPDQTEVDENMRLLLAQGEDSEIIDTDADDFLSTLSKGITRLI